MKNKIVEDLLELHCNHCHGKAFNCIGCDKEEKINEILSLYLKEPEQVPTEVGEEIIIEKPKKITKKK